MLRAQRDPLFMSWRPYTYPGYWILEDLIIQGISSSQGPPLLTPSGSCLGNPSQRVSSEADLLAQIRTNDGAILCTKDVPL